MNLNKDKLENDVVCYAKFRLAFLNELINISAEIHTLGHISKSTQIRELAS